MSAEQRQGKRLHPVVWAAPGLTALILAAAGAYDYVRGVPLASCIASWLLGTGAASALAILFERLSESHPRLREEIARCQEAEEARRQYARHAMLLDQAGKAFSSAHNIDQALAEVMEATRQTMDATSCSVWLLAPETGELLCRHAAGSAAPEAGSGVVGQAVHTGDVQIVPDVRTDARRAQEPDRQTGAEARAILCIPLRFKQEVIGALSVMDSRPARFGPADGKLLDPLTTLIATAIGNSRLHEETKRQQEMLRALARRLAEAEEAEWQRLARELHDQVGQSLTALGINLNILRASLAGEAPGALQARLEDSLMLLEQVTQRVRNLMVDLRPPVLDDYGLTAALRWYGEQHAARLGIAVQVRNGKAMPRLSPSVEIALFRIFQEALTNVVKHAQATQVTVSLEEDLETVRMIIADNGVGFDPARQAGPGTPPTWGLITMAERALAVGGRFRIESRPGEGTRVIVEIARWASRSS